MKKFLLSLAAVSMTASMALADHTIFDFMGSEDAYGLTRQTDPKNYEGTTELTAEQDGVTMTLKSEPASLFGRTGTGFSLVKFGVNREGLGLYCSTLTMSFTVPNGTITGAQVVINGYNVPTMELDINGKLYEGTDISNVDYCYTWSDEAGAETITLSMPAVFDWRYIHTVDLTYQRDLGGKKPADLSFSATSAEVVMDDIKGLPELSNPNNLPVTWTSSNEEIATVDAEGKLDLKAPGTVVITATTPGNDEFGDGNAKYTLTVIGVATSIADLEIMAPVYGNKVKVNFPMIVTFGNGNYAFVKDAEDNATMVYDARNDGSTAETPTIYSAGDVIPAGWIATNQNLYESPDWKGLPADGTEKVQVVYPEVEKVTPADNDRVVILKQVTFETRTPSDYQKAYGTTPDGGAYQFEDTYAIGGQPAGCYDVTCVVRYAKMSGTVYFWLAPIKYEIYKESAVESVETEESARYFNLQGLEVANPTEGLYIKVTNGKSEKVILK